MAAIEGLPGNGRIDAQQGHRWRHKPVGAQRQAGVCFQQAFKGIGGAGTPVADHLFGPAAVINSMVGLHHRYYLQLGKARYIGRQQMLGVLYPEPAIARAVFAGHLLVDIEQHMVGAVANGMHAHLQAGPVGPLDPFIQRVGRIDKVAVLARCIAVGIEKSSRMRAQRAIYKAFESTPAQPFVTAACRIYFSL